MSVLKLIHENIKTIGDLSALSFRENGAWKTKSWREFGEELAQVSNALKSLGIKTDLGFFLIIPKTGCWWILPISH